MYRKYYSINDMPQPIQKKEEAGECKRPDNIHKNVEEKVGFIQNGKVLGRFEIDDVILVVIAVILLADDCDDKLLLLALAFVFLSGTT